MAIYIFKDNQKTGPFEESQVREGIESGQYSLDTRAWAEGLPSWTTLGQILFREAPTPPSPDNSIPRQSGMAKSDIPAPLPPATRKLITIAVVSLVALIVCIWSWSAYRSYQTSQPGYVLQVLKQCNTMQDVEENSQYFTDQGKQVAEWVLSKGDAASSPNENWTYSTPVITGDTYSAQVTAGNVSFTFILKNNGRWQFDDMTLNEANGKEIGLNASYMMSHPVMTWLRLNWEDAATQFLKGFAIGAAAAGGG